MVKKTNLFKYLMLTLVFSGLTMYLFQVEKLTSDNYQSKEYETQANTLNEENNALEKEYLQKFSMKGALEKTGELGFVRTSRVKYIPVAFDYLARETTY